MAAEGVGEGEKKTDEIEKRANQYNPEKIRKGQEKKCNEKRAGENGTSLSLSLLISTSPPNHYLPTS